MYLAPQRSGAPGTERATERRLLRQRAGRGSWPATARGSSRLRARGETESRGQGERRRRGELPNRGGLALGSWESSFF